MRMGSALLTLLSLMCVWPCAGFSPLSFSAFHMDFAKEGASELLGADSRGPGALPLGGVHPLDRSWAQGRQSLAWEQWVLRAGG